MESEMSNDALYSKWVEASWDLARLKREKLRTSKRLGKATSAAVEKLLNDPSLNQKAVDIQIELNKIETEIFTTNRLTSEVRERLDSKFTSVGFAPAFVTAVPGKISFFGSCGKPEEKSLTFIGSYAVYAEKWQGRSSPESLTKVSEIAHSVFEGIKLA